MTTWKDYKADTRKNYPEIGKDLDEVEDDILEESIPIDLQDNTINITEIITINFFILSILLILSVYPIKP